MSEPTDEEVEEQFAEWREQGIEPGLVRIEIVNSPRTLRPNQADAHPVEGAEFALVAP